MKVQVQSQIQTQIQIRLAVLVTWSETLVKSINAASKHTESRITHANTEYTNTITNHVYSGKNMYVCTGKAQEFKVQSCRKYFPVGFRFWSWSCTKSTAFISPLLTAQKYEALLAQSSQLWRDKQPFLKTQKYAAKQRPISKILNNFVLWWEKSCVAFFPSFF